MKIRMLSVSLSVSLAALLLAGPAFALAEKSAEIQAPRGEHPQAPRGQNGQAPGSSGLAQAVMASLIAHADYSARRVGGAEEVSTHARVRVAG